MDRPLFATSSRDAWVLGAAMIHASLWAVGLSTAAGVGWQGRAALAVVLGVAMNWCANTVSHIHLHTPLFRAPILNRAFSMGLSVLLAVPQGWWTLRHWVHHELPEAADVALRRSLRLQAATEVAVIAAVFVGMMVFAPILAATVYAPALAIGFALCAVQGIEEHARDSAGVDVHGRIYNRLWFNDGFHAAHHRAPQSHWTTLPAQTMESDTVSAWPPILRWMDGGMRSDRVAILLNGVSCVLINVAERAALHVPFLLTYLLWTHERAWRRLLVSIDKRQIGTVTIVGGGLFPRTALVLRRLLPDAEVTIVDAQAAHLENARVFFDPLDSDVPHMQIAMFDSRWTVVTADLLVLPLAFHGDRKLVYAQPPAHWVVVHDWLWRRRGTTGTRVSFLLAKRLNLVVRDVEAAQVHEESEGHREFQVARG